MKRVDSTAKFERKLALVCEEFCRGESVDQIVLHLRNTFKGEKISRETPYRLLRIAAQREWLKFQGLSLENYSRRLAMASYPVFDSSLHLDPVTVVQSAGTTPVADATAEMVLKLIEEKAKSGKKRVHVAWAGGKTMALTAKLLSIALKNAEEDGSMRLPETIVWHSLMAGFDPNWPGLSPAGFLATIAEPRPQEDRRLKHEFVVFGAPPIVTFELYEKIKEMPTVDEAFKRKHEIDIIVSSAGSWADDHSVLKQLSPYFDKHRDSKHSSKKFADFLERRDCIGDLLWLPLFRGKELTFTLEASREFDFRPMTLVELHELPELIKGGVKVVLAVGNCDTCKEPKDDILGEVIRVSKISPAHRLITNLVANKDTCERVLKQSQ
jgi:hypothetical protein